MFLLLCLSMVFADEKFASDIFDLEGKTKLFTYEGSRTYVKDVMTYATTFKDAQTGETVATEKAEIKNGEIVKYEVARVSSKETGLMEVKDGKLHFTYVDDGKKSEAKEDLKSDTLISATLVPHLEKNFSQLLEKKEVNFRYAVWFRKETVGFQFTLDNIDGDKAIFKMNPTNFLYKSLVKPIYFTLDKNSKKLLSIKGRTLPRQKVGSSWKDLDALAIYK